MGEGWRKGKSVKENNNQKKALNKSRGIVVNDEINKTATSTRGKVSAGGSLAKHTKLRDRKKQQDKKRDAARAGVIQKDETQSWFAVNTLELVLRIGGDWFDIRALRALQQVCRQLNESFLGDGAVWRGLTQLQANNIPELCTKTFQVGFLSNYRRLASVSLINCPKLNGLAIMALAANA